MGDAKYDITVLLATRNRANTLAETLDAFARLDPAGPETRFVIADNGSTDGTTDLLARYDGPLALTALREDRPGKNVALNRALETVELAPIVVFTDDDVTPASDWLVQVAAACQRWPDAMAFGGRIEVAWPVGVEAPAWASDATIGEFAFARHEIDQPEGRYSPDVLPFGPNFWARRAVFASGRRLDETSGAHHRRPILADETMLLADLARAGETIIHVPGAVVAHRVQPEVVQPANLYRRAVDSGRSVPHHAGLPRRALLDRCRPAWRALYAAAWGAFRLRAELARLHPCATRRVVRRALDLRLAAHCREALRLAGGR